jgi:membrane protein DedA with SNARE-associated domain
MQKLPAQHDRFSYVFCLTHRPGDTWPWTPLQDWLEPQQGGAGFIGRISLPGGRALIAVAGVVLPSVLMVPLTFLAVVGAVAFPGWLAFIYLLVGALLDSAWGFVGGWVMNRGELEPISGSRLKQLSRQLAKRGTLRLCSLQPGGRHLAPGGSGRSSSGACWGWPPA